MALAHFLRSGHWRLGVSKAHRHRLIVPGVHREELVVSKPHLTLRGLDRNQVFLDGEFKQANGMEVLGADHVVIENITALHLPRLPSVAPKTHMR